MIIKNHLSQARKCQNPSPKYQKSVNKANTHSVDSLCKKTKDTYSSNTIICSFKQLHSKLCERDIKRFYSIMAPAMSVSSLRSKYALPFSDDYQNSSLTDKKGQSPSSNYQIYINKANTRPVEAFCKKKIEDSCSSKQSFVPSNGSTQNFVIGKSPDFTQ